jgi:hypothetical protein
VTGWLELTENWEKRWEDDDDEDDEGEGVVLNQWAGDLPCRGVPSVDSSDGSDSDSMARYRTTHSRNE